MDTLPRIRIHITMYSNRAGKAGVIMDTVLNKNIPVERELLSALDRGIDDMESGRTLSLEDAFEKITELREERRSAKS